VSEAKDLLEARFIETEATLNELQQKSSDIIKSIANQHAIELQAKDRAVETEASLRVDILQQLEEAIRVNKQQQTDFELILTKINQLEGQKQQLEAELNASRQMHAELQSNANQRSASDAEKIAHLESTIELMTKESIASSDLQQNETKDNEAQHLREVCLMF